MRVLVVSPWPPQQHFDGSALILRHHLHELAGRHDIRLLVPARRLPAGADYLVRRARSEVTGEPAHVHYVARRPLLRELTSTVSNWRPDVVHLFGWGTAGLWPYAGTTPTLHVAVDPWRANLANRRLPRWRALADAGQAAKVARHEARHYPRVGAVVVVAPQDAERLRAQVPQARVEVVANGVDPGPEPAASAATQRVLGFHGSMDARSNEDAARWLVTEVWPRVRLQVPEASVLLVGARPSAAVRRLAGPGVTVTGEVPDVRPHLSRVGVYVAAMRSGTGLKNKVLEAMAAGLPVVATPLALQGIGAGPGVVEAAGAEALAAAAVALLRDPRRPELGAAGRRRVLAEFGWPASAAGIERLWRELAG